MKKTILLLFIISLLQQTKAQQPSAFSIKAFLPFWKGSTIRLLVDGTPVDSIRLQSDMYSFNSTTTVALPGTLEIKKDKAVHYLSFFVEPGTIKIIDAGNNRLSASGTQMNDAYAKLVKELDEMASFHASLPELKNYRRTLSASYIATHPASLISLRLLYDYFYLDNAIDDTTYYPLFHGLSETIKNTRSAQKIAAEAAVSRATALGVKAPNLQLPGTTGIPTLLYNNSGITLIDFWASWCLPCRRETPALLAVFRKFSNRGFSITSVSLDHNPALWQQAVQKDGMQWNHVSDLKAWNGQAVQLFGVKTIPMNFLVNGDGVILAKNLSPSALAAKLEEILPAE